MSLQKVYYRDWAAARCMPFAFVVSRLAAPLSRVLAAHGVRPNQVTLVAAILGAVAVAGAGVGAWPLAAGCLVASLVFDHVDGQIARSTNQRSILGGYLDTLSDILVDTLVLMAITVWGVLNDPRVALLGLAAVVARSLFDLIGRHNGWTTTIEALRAQDFRPPVALPTVPRSRISPITPHRDLDVAVLTGGLVFGLLPLALAGLTVWWTAWSLSRIAQGVDRPKNTEGVLSTLMHEDNH